MAPGFLVLRFASRECRWYVPRLRISEDLHLNCSASQSGLVFNRVIFCRHTPVSDRGSLCRSCNCADLARLLALQPSQCANTRNHITRRFPYSLTHASLLSFRPLWCLSLSGSSGSTLSERLPSQTDVVFCQDLVRPSAVCSTNLFVVVLKPPCATLCSTCHSATPSQWAVPI